MLSAAALRTTDAVMDESGRPVVEAKLTDLHKLSQ
jgi:hypothetical protein